MYSGGTGGEKLLQVGAILRRCGKNAGSTNDVIFVPAGAPKRGIGNLRPNLHRRSEIVIVAGGEKISGCSFQRSTERGRGEGRNWTVNGWIFDCQRMDLQANYLLATLPRER